MQRTSLGQGQSKTLARYRILHEPLIDQVPKFTLFERPSLTIAFNLTGSPAMSVCCGYTDGGLPLSLQIVGKRFTDATVLRLAHAYEQATPWRGRRPQL